MADKNKNGEITMVTSPLMSGENNDHINPMRVLDYCVQPMFFLNHHFELIYLNKSAAAFFEKNQQHFRQIDLNYIPNLLTERFTILADHFAPQLEKMMQLQEGARLVETISIGILHVEFQITPIFSDAGKPVAFCFEIQDRTMLIHTLCVLEEAIYTAEKGIFDQKVPLDVITTENPDFLLVSQKVNILFEKIQGFFGELTCILDNIMRGRFRPIACAHEAEQQDSFFDTTKNDLNYVLEKFSSFVKNIQSVSNLMQYTLERINSKNTLLAMAAEKEQTEINETEAQLHTFLEGFHTNNLEIHQAIEVAHSLSNDYDIIGDLRLMFQSVLSDVYERIIHTLDVIKSINFTLRGHLDALRGALQEIEKGNIGKGIQMVTQECEVMILTTNDLMQNIYHAFTAINQSVDAKQASIDANFEMLSAKVYATSEIVMMMSAILEEIQKNLYKQDDFFDDMKHSIKYIKQSHHLTYQTTQKMVVLTSVLGYLSHNLKNAVNLFEAAQTEDGHLNYQQEIESLLTQHDNIADIPVQSVIELFKT